jgi:voltage-gated potassium channel
MTKRDDRELADLQRRVTNAALLLLALFVTGVFGYKLVGGPQHTWLDALYMATITLTTTGMRDVIPTNTPAAEAFTIAYLIFGATAALYTLSTITAFIVEGDLTRGFRRRRMQSTIDAMNDHYVVCGAGQTGVAVLRELVSTERSCVVIEHHHDHFAAAGHDFPSVPALHGDCSDDETLTRAGVQRAAGIVVCTDDDKTALVTTVLARQLNPKIRIVARATTERAASRLRQAGADGVVAPALIGGMRLASELVRPSVVTFLDQMLRDTNRNLRIEEVEVSAKSSFVGKPVSELHLHEYGSGLLLLAMRHSSGDYAFNPAADTLVSVGAHLIVMGDPPSVNHLEDEASPKAA